MNKNQVKGTVKEAAGKAQSAVGKVTGSTEQRVKGMAKEVAGKAQKQAGNVQQAYKESSKESNRRA